MRLFGRKSRSFTLRPEPVGRGPELGTVPEIRVEAPPADDDDHHHNQQQRRQPESQQRACNSNGDQRNVENERSAPYDDEDDEGMGSKRKEKAERHAYDPVFFGEAGETGSVRGEFYARRAPARVYRLGWFKAEPPPLFFPPHLPLPTQPTLCSAVALFGVHPLTRYISLCRFWCDYVVVSATVTR